MQLKLKNIFALGAASVLLLSATGCQKLQSRDSLNKGVREYKATKYNEAVKYFQRAVDLDPDFATARLYLATAYMSQYIPGAESEENKKFAQEAYDNFQKVLDKDPNDKLAIASIASLYFNQKNLKEAKAWNERLLKVDPQNKEALYTLGVIAWTNTFQPRMEARAKLNMKPEDPGPIKDKKVREALKATNMPIIEEGLKNLEAAVQIDPSYDDALAYLNLLHREKADLADTVDEYKSEIDLADKYVGMALEAKKRKAEEANKKAGSGIQQETK